MFQISGQRVAAAGTKEVPLRRRPVAPVLPHGPPPVSRPPPGRRRVRDVHPVARGGERHPGQEGRAPRAGSQRPQGGGQMLLDGFFLRLSTQ